MLQRQPTVMITAEALAARVRELGEKITADYAGQELTVVGVLNGTSRSAVTSSG